MNETILQDGILSAYQVKLEEFEGPLDLLLHLIKKNELDISKVSISQITEQYLLTIDMMKTLNLEVAGEYLVMAATLAHIKSKTLLPEDSIPDTLIDDEEESEEDLVRRLLEYQRFKEAGNHFEAQLWLGRDVFVRAEKLPAAVSREIKPVSLFTLVELFYERLKKMPKIYAHEVTMERMTVAQRMGELLAAIERHPQRAIPFIDLLGETRTRYDVIVTFLALLEMVRVSLVHLTQADDFSPILIAKGKNQDPSLLNQGEINYAE